MSWGGDSREREADTWERKREENPSSVETDFVARLWRPTYIQVAQVQFKVIDFKFIFCTF